MLLKVPHGVFGFQVHNLIGRGERTVGGFIDLLANSGWEVVEVRRCPGAEQCHIIGKLL
jgi:hypothetical protein